MRSDLTPAFIAAKNASKRKPRQLLVFQFPGVGNVYISDQEIDLGGITYQALVEDWGTLEEAAEVENSNSSEIRQMSVTIWNGGDTPFSDYFLQEDPENVEVLLYQWFVGLTDDDKVLLDRFTVQDPISFDERSRLLTLDLVSINMRYDGNCGDFVTTEIWPDAKPEHVGRGIPLIFGDAGQVECLYVKTAPMATLNGSMVKRTAIIDVNESLDNRGFPASGVVEIDEELIQYSSRTEFAFTVQTRGYGQTTIADHGDGAQLHQYINDHTFLAGEGPITAMTEIKVAGCLAPNSIYSVSFSGTYGKIIFNQKPYSIQFAPSVEKIELGPDTISGNNTAWQPFYAFDQEKTTSSALINEAYPTLALVNNSLYEDLGRVTTAYLLITHWETNVYTNDYVQVWVEGVGEVGRLAKPSPSDVFQLDAEIDVDHEHDHKTGDKHSHSFNNPSYSADVGVHAHPLAGTGMTYVAPAGGVSLPFKQYEYSGYTIVNPTYSWNNPGTDFQGAYMSVQAYLSGADLELMQGNTRRAYWNDDTVSSIITEVPMGETGDIYFKVHGKGVVGGSARIDKATFHITFGADMENSRSTVDPYLSTAGDNDDTHNTNNPDDVVPLLTDNRVLEIVSRKNPGRTITDRFDLSDHVDPTWNWFTGREIQLRYVGTGDDVNVFIPHITFQIEFKRRQRVFSDQVTVTVAGDPSNSPEQVIQRLLTEKAGLPSAYIDTLSFAAVASEYTAIGYRVDGIIEAELSVREALKKVCWQTRSRLHWNAGQAKLLMKKAAAELTIDKNLLPINYQLKSIQITRQRLADLVNSIQLFYQIDRVNREQPYLASITSTDTDSITQHGKKENRELFQFDLVRNDAMAADLVAYYVSISAYPSSFYEFNAYLEQFDLEKEDVIEVTSAGFNQMRKVPMIIRAVNRIFGSGKNKQINHLRIIAENLRYILLDTTLSDTVHIMDDLEIIIGKVIDLADSIHVTDELSFIETANLEETVIIADVLEIIWAISETLSDTITISDSLGADMVINLTDEITITDNLTIYRQVGFGSGAFGMEGFGGITKWVDSDEDEVKIIDELTMEEVTNLSDTVVISDNLICSNGFGCVGNLSSGFGNTPFGQ